MFSESKKSPLIDSNGNHTDWNVYEKKFEDEETDGEVDYNLPDDIIYDYLNSSASTYLNNMGIDFQFSKPWELVAYLIDITMKSSDISVLDFFAGSGTTLDAIMKMNDGDGGHRKGILVTNNENNICQEVTHPRIYKVIQGYKTVKGKTSVPGLTRNTLRYYKTKLLPRDKTTKNLRLLMRLATDMLCIRNDVYTERPFAGKALNEKIARYFESTDGSMRMLVLYREEAVKPAVRLIAQAYEGEGGDAAKTMVYVFSPNGNAYDDEFDDVADRVRLCALPDAILNAYRRVLPKRAPWHETITEEGGDEA